MKMLVKSSPVLLIVLLVAGYLYWQASAIAAPVVSASVSSDGRYALTAHRDNQLILWDLKEREKSRISGDANIYSASFVKGNSVFIWQDLSDQVYVQDVSGEILEQFMLSTPTYGHLMTSDLRDYYFSDIGWGIHHRSKNGQIETLKATDRKAFRGFGKLLNLSIDNNEQLLLSAGTGEPRGFSEPYYRTLKEERTLAKDYGRLNSIALWNLRTGKPIAKLNGNKAKTHATLSPDGKWAISADENGNLLFWDTDKPGEMHLGARDGLGVFQMGLPEGLESSEYWDDSNIIDPPPGVTAALFHVSFISKSQYFLRFNNGSHKAALFKAGNPWPQRYFDLGASPALVTYGSQYSRNTAIATAPEAGVLVMGHKSDGGLSVYRFDAQTKTLERTWVVD